MDEMISSRVALSHKTSQSETRRRKVRKGTHSCWECKRRKMKCIIDPLTNAICNSCRRRGSKCVSQEFPDEISPAVEKPQRTGDRVRGAQVYLGAGDTSDDVITANDGVLTPASLRSESSQHLGFYEPSGHRTFKHAGSRLSKPQSIIATTTWQVKHNELSSFLHKSLPSREDIERICKASSRPSVLGYEVMTMPYPILDETGLKTSEALLDIPEENLHPVLIAKYMLSLAIFLQYLHPAVHDEIKGLSEPPRDMRERLADHTIRLVTSNDELLGSIEGLECIMLEGLYQANFGNLRRSWVTGRRALGIAQLMGLGRSSSRPQYKVLDPKTKYDPQYMWYRIVFLDRLLCLMLGLPQGCLDRTMASEANLADDSPYGRLERIHCVVASQILERNETNPSSQDFALTRSLDLELQKAAKVVPSSWWLPPDLDAAAKDSQTLFWDTRRLIAQVYHYNLLNQLHLPYMLRSSAVERNKYEYSRITCVNASREVLSRFIALRSFNKLAYSCRSIDFLALMSAMTLLLAHLESHRSSEDNLLAHQYHSDRGMIEQAQKNMLEVNRMSSDALSAKSADLLGRLLAIDIEATNSYGGVEQVVVHGTGTSASGPGQDDDPVASVHIPYFGIIKIAREGMSKESPEPQASNHSGQPRLLDRCGVTSSQPTHAEREPQTSGLDKSRGLSNLDDIVQADADYNNTGVSSSFPPETLNAYAKSRAHLEAVSMPITSPSGVAADFTSQLQCGLSDSLLAGEYPELAAGGEDWAFQGVDMAFFESLMRSSGDANEEVEWASWER